MTRDFPHTYGEIQRFHWQWRRSTVVYYEVFAGSCFLMLAYRTQGARRASGIQDDTVASHRSLNK